MSERFKDVGGGYITDLYTGVVVVVVNVSALTVRDSGIVMALIIDTLDKNFRVGGANGSSRNN